MKIILSGLALFAIAHPLQAQSQSDYTSAFEAAASDGFSGVTSVVIMQNGEVVAERYFDSEGSEALRNTRSVTKTVTGMLAGVAIADGSLSLDAQVASFFPIMNH